MPTRFLVAATLAALTLIGSALPGSFAVSRAVAASCSGWTSESQPPPSIRVFRHASGAVETVDFRTYTKNVLSREWIGSWTAESLRSGALAVKSYAWYQVLHWRGGTNASGQCFDLRDDTYDQVYDPSKPTWSTAAAAVDATWGTRVLKNGLIFPTYYNAGASGEACGANANGWKMYQWGTQGCGLAGKTAAQIMLTYYWPGVTVTDAPAATPSPTPSPSPTAAPTPTPAASPGSTASPTAAPTLQPTPVATAVPTPVPTPVATPLPTPPPVQALPGGGQAGVERAAAPPPPPPANPEPVVVGAVTSPEPARSRFSGSLSVAERSAAAMRRHLERVDDGPVADRGAWAREHVVAAFKAPGAGVMATDVRLVAFGTLWEDAMSRLADALVAQLAGESPSTALNLPGR
ncbi:MAG TPA: SpoIID/LytB domain-containing protein [Candidatus Limnocylindria bacterium]|nr:SpoIID/LytB domain-containing protein [Candidatus Limnocylindria bacterium]